MKQVTLGIKRNNLNILEEHRPRFHFNLLCDLGQALRLSLVPSPIETGTAETSRGCLAPTVAINPLWLFNFKLTAMK